MIQNALAFPRRRPVAGGGSFAPTDIAGLQFWVKADAGITKDGSNIVSAWADQSGNGRDLSGSGSAQPLWVSSLVNSLPAVRFDGSDDVMTTSSFTTTQPLTVFILMKNVSVTNTERAWSSASGSNNPNLQQITGPSLRLQSNATTGASVSTDTSNFALYKCLYNGTSSVIAKNNGSDQTAAGNLSGSTTLIALGGLSASSFGNVEIAEFLLYNSSITGTNLTNVLSYFQTRYALW